MSQPHRLLIGRAHTDSYTSNHDGMYLYDYINMKYEVNMLATVATTLNRKSICEKSFKTYQLSQNLIIISSDELNRRYFSRASILTR